VQHLVEICEANILREGTALVGLTLGDYLLTPADTEEMA